MSRSQNILLWELIGWLWYVLCVSTVLCLILDSPEPWLGPVVCMKILSSCSYPPGNDATVNMGGSLAFPFLLLSDQSYSFCHRRSKFSAATMSHIQISNTLVGYCWCVVKPFIAVLMLYKRECVLGAMGVPYNGWAWTCCGLAMAGACTKHRPCYWSQTTFTLSQPWAPILPFGRC